ncbi:hypothetical protein NKF26_11970 [Haladaptatus sp. AB618]|uniref:hypothetical protein n=1 Tax=Haladaptatus sp. AB618 TaxID=2934173 RepID=UPI00209BC99E|nr:hypothetical protein [Haladaptatus sp. AB618]MCO8254519.1 hypothetical protein [Haladaptatus sp. AB618]
MDIISILSSVLRESWALIGTAITGFVIYEKKEYDRIQNLRRAFLAELNSVDLPTKIKLNDGRKVPPPYSAKLVPTTIYDTNASRIGKLTSEEVDSLTEYYSKSKNINYLSDVMFDMGHTDSDAPFEHLNTKRTTAIETVENALNQTFGQYLIHKLNIPISYSDSSKKSV